MQGDVKVFYSSAPPPPPPPPRPPAPHTHTHPPPPRTPVFDSQLVHIRKHINWQSQMFNL